MCSLPFRPGTKVYARAKNNKYIWRPAKVVESLTDQPPHTVTVTFVGRTEQVHLPLQNVKLPPNVSNDTVDLTDDAHHHQHQTPSQVPQAAPLPTFSDPFNDSHEKTTTPTPQSTDHSSSISSPSHPGTDTPYLPSSEPLVSHQSIPENTRQSSRDWLLARPSTQSDRNLVTAQSEAHFRPSQRQPQVVRDPLFTRPQYPPNSYPHSHLRGNSDSLPRDVPHDRLTDAELQQPFSFPGEQNFVPFTQRTQPPGFQFKAVRTHTKPNLQHSSLPREPSYQACVPPKSTAIQEVPTEVQRTIPDPPATTVDQQITSNSHSAWSRGSCITNSSAPPRNGLTRNPEPHLHRSVDERFQISRTAVAQEDLPRVPRHPQSSFDDDIPIPRNTLPKLAVTNAIEQDAADIDEANDLHPAYKRQRVGYRYMSCCQMPPSAQAETAMHKLSRRLAKREREYGRKSRKSSTGHVALRSLPYQCPVQRENGIVRIALNFDSSQAFTTLSEETSDADTKVLEEVFADLSVNSDFPVNSDDANVRHHGIIVSQAPRRTVSLVVRGGGRRKSNPKKWCSARPHHGRNIRAYSEFNFCESGVGSNCVSSEDPLDCSMGEHKAVENSPIPRVYGCTCQNESEERRLICNDICSIQCCVCTLWFHTKCIGFGPDEIKFLQKWTLRREERYICIECVDAATGSLASNSRHHLFPNVFHEGAKWISSVHNFSHLMSGLSVVTTDTSLHSNLGPDKCIRGCVWIRDPLVQDEISARVNNLEQLREGITNASVGMRERSLFDERLGYWDNRPEVLEQRYELESWTSCD